MNKSIIAGAIVLCSMCNGCSFFMTPATSLPCTSSYVLPRVDATVAGVSAIAAATVIGVQNDQIQADGNTGGPGITPASGALIGVTAAYAIAAGYGFINATRCQDLKGQ